VLNKTHDKLLRISHIKGPKHETYIRILGLFTFLGQKMALALLVAISGPQKKSRYSGPTPSNGPSN
jgi:hypothetical protein